MLAPAKLEALQQIIPQYSREELLWISGYLAGIAGSQAGTSAPAVLNDHISIVYGTETGNSKKVAAQLSARLKQAQHKVKLTSADQYKPEWLAKEKQLIVVISTQGEGEPPAQAKAFYDHLHQRSEALPHLRYAVIALGSRSYPLFCQAGIDIDTQLRRLHAQPITAMALCDDDYEPIATAWIDGLLQILAQQLPAKPAASTVASTTTDTKKQYHATLAVKQLLNDVGSQQAVYHIEFDLPEEANYIPGNAIGLVPQNDAATIDKLLQLLRIPGSKMLLYKGQQVPASTLLQQYVSVRYLSSGVLKKYAQLIGADIPDTRLDLYDLLRMYPLPDELDAQWLVDLLNPISPRLYTIASSPNAHPGQLHLTVALERFNTSSGQQHGLASGWLTQLPVGAQVSFFLHTQKNFQLPRSDKHLIMICRGTGIAPFRSMLAERDATGATGRNWLFFAEENFVTDFYYQTEIQAWYETGSLHHVSLAFEKNRQRQLQMPELLLLEADKLWQWIDSGAYLMVSGKKEYMGKPVEEALLQIIQQKKNTDAAGAQAFLKQLQKEGLYAKELY
jgi:sulfite reductase (NADPH) flavoprotein alpha-component